MACCNGTGQACKHLGSLMRKMNRICVCFAADFFRGVMDHVPRPSQTTPLAFLLRTIRNKNASEWSERCSRGQFLKTKVHWMKHLLDLTLWMCQHRFWVRHTLSIATGDFVVAFRVVFRSRCLPTSRGVDFRKAGRTLHPTSIPIPLQDLI